MRFKHRRAMPWTARNTSLLWNWTKMLVFKSWQAGPLLLLDLRENLWLMEFWLTNPNLRRISFQPKMGLQSCQKIWKLLQFAKTRARLSIAHFSSFLNLRPLEMSLLTAWCERRYEWAILMNWWCLSIKRISLISISKMPTKVLVWIQKTIFINNGDHAIS